MGYILVFKMTEISLRMRHWFYERGRGFTNDVWFSAQGISSVKFCLSLQDYSLAYKKSSHWHRFIKKETIVYDSFLHALIYISLVPDKSELKNIFSDLSLL